MTCVGMVSIGGSFASRTYWRSAGPISRKFGSLPSSRSTEIFSWSGLFLSSRSSPWRCSWVLRASYLPGPGTWRAPERWELPTQLAKCRYLLFGMGWRVHSDAAEAMTDETCSKIGPMRPLTWGIRAPAATAKKPPIRAYSRRFCPRRSFQTPISELIDLDFGAVQQTDQPANRQVSYSTASQ